jgi:transcriptional regulator with XRE-family HTH domain
MPIRQGPSELGAADAERVRRLIGQELRETRLALGLSQRAVAKAARISSSRLGRIERGETLDPSVGAVCRAARAIGLTLSLKLYPAGSPIRDHVQIGLARRFGAVLAAPLRLRGETVLPGQDDLRAWDGMVDGPDAAAFVEFEGRLGDVQALSRRLALKLRDDARGSVVILVVARTRHNQRVFAEVREQLRVQFPLDGAAIVRQLRAGRIPAASGIIVV